MGLKITGDLAKRRNSVEKFISSLSCTNLVRKSFVRKECINLTECKEHAILGFFTNRPTTFNGTLTPTEHPSFDSLRSTV